MVMSIVANSYNVAPYGQANGIVLNPKAAISSISGIKPPSFSAEFLKVSRIDIDFASGKKFANRYRLTRQLGTGGMGSVYLAEDCILEGEKIALKILHHQFTKDDKHTRRFLREVQLTRRITHPNVVRTFDVGEAEGHLFFSMEYGGSSTLADMHENRPINFADIIPIVLALGEGLMAIHENGIIHRDLKPSNVLVGESGVLKISDFGVARQGLSTLTGINEAVGSAAFMSPEMWRGDEVTSAADLYALGALIVQLATGVIPFKGDTLVTLMHAHLEQPTPTIREQRSDYPEWFDTLVQQMLKKDPSERPASAQEIVNTVRTRMAPEVPTTHHEGLLVKERFPTDSALTDSALQHTQPEDPHSKDTSVQSTSSITPQSSLTSRAFRFLARLTFGIAAALIIGALLGFGAKHIAHELWASMGSEPDFLSSFAGFTTVVMCFLALFALPAAAAMHASAGWRAAVRCCLLTALLGAGILVAITSYHAARGSATPENLSKSHHLQRMQWYTELGMRNAIEVAYLVPRGSTFYAPSDAEPLRAYELTDTPTYFSLGSESTDEFLSRTHSLALPLVPHYNFTGNDRLMYFGCLFIYLSFLIWQLHSEQIRYKQFGPQTRYGLMALTGGSALFIIIAEYLLEDWATRRFPSLMGEILLPLGPFPQPLSQYGLMCAALNLTLIMSYTGLLVLKRSARPQS